MSLQITKEVVASGVQVWQKVFETAQGGFTLDTTDSHLGQLWPLALPFLMMRAPEWPKPLKTAEVVENAGGSSHRLQGEEKDPCSLLANTLPM